MAYRVAIMVAAVNLGALVPVAASLSSQGVWCSSVAVCTLMALPGRQPAQVQQAQEGASPSTAQPTVAVTGEGVLEPVVALEHPLALCTLT